MMMNRVLGVFKLDVNTFEEIEHDTNGTTQAATVVAVVAACGAIGQAMAAQQRVGSMVGAVLVAFLGWLAWSFTTLLIGTKVFNGKADLGEMLRVLGFAQAPMALQILAGVPLLGALAGLAGGIWALCAGFIAVRQGLDISNLQTFITIFLGLLVYLLILAGITFGLAILFGTAALVSP